MFKNIDEREIGEILDRILRAATRHLKYYDLAGLTRGFPVPGVQVLKDATHLRHGDDLRYVMLLYKGHHVGTVYQHKVWKDGHHLDPDVSKRIWDAVEQYAINPLKE